MEQGLHAGQVLAQVALGVQPDGSHLDQDGLDAAVDHGLQQLRLRLAPQVGQGDQAQSRACLQAAPHPQLSQSFD